MNADRTGERPRVVSKEGEGGEGERKLAHLLVELGSKGEEAEGGRNGEPSVEIIAKGEVGEGGGEVDERLMRG